MADSLKLPTDAMDGILMAGVYVGRDLVISGKAPRLGKAAIVGASQYGYNMLARDKLRAYLATMTGEEVYSSILANTLGLATVIYLLSMLGLAKADELKEGDVLPSPKGKGKGAKVMKALLTSGELVIEKNIVEYILGYSGIYTAGAAKPVAAVRA
jgi:hypothetical protein